MGFHEKPITKYNVSMGVYMANKEILNFIPEDEKFGFDNLMHELIRKNRTVLVREYNGFWLDIGCPSDYERAHNNLDKILPLDEE